MIELDEVRSSILAAIDRLEPVEVPSSEALGLVLGGRRRVVRADPAVRQHRDGRVRGARRRAPPGPRPTRRFASAWWESCPAGHAPTIPVGDGEAIRIMTGAPMPDGADAIVMVERTERDGVDGVLVQQEAPRGRSRAPGGRRRRTR